MSNAGTDHTVSAHGASHLAVERSALSSMTFGLASIQRDRATQDPARGMTLPRRRHFVQAWRLVILRLSISADDLRPARLRVIQWRHHETPFNLGHCRAGRQRNRHLPGKHPVQSTTTSKEKHFVLRNCDSVIQRLQGLVPGCACGLVIPPCRFRLSNMYFAQHWYLAPTGDGKFYGSSRRLDPQLDKGLAEGWQVSD
ncbi:hypothetical protein VUR80DRAFT_3363 [Thermomyces stellatus]